MTHRLDRYGLRDQYAAAHVVVVPTRSTFNEGLAMVAAEAILAGRPVLLSDVVPAGEVLGEAAIEVRADDPASYAQAIQNLADDPDEYARRAAACLQVREQFYDRSLGLGEALGGALDSDSK